MDDIETVHTAAQTVFQRFYVKRTQLPTTTSVLTVPDGDDIAVVVDCTNTTLTQLSKQVRAFIRALPDNMTLRAAIHATTSVYVMTVTVTSVSATSDDAFTAPETFGVGHHTVSHSPVQQTTQSTAKAPPNYKGQRQVSNGHNAHVLKFQDIAQCIKNLQAYHKSVPDCFHHDDDAITDYELDTSDGTDGTELTVYAYSDSHHVTLKYFVTFDKSLNILAVEPSATNECRECEHEWNDAHPEPPH